MNLSLDIMRREIEAQPDALRTALPALRLMAAAVPWPRPPGRVIFCGCGDSLTAPGLLGHALSAAGRSVAVASTQEVVSYLSLASTDLVVGCSISGGTAATVAAVRAARLAGSLTCAITCHEDSPLARAADHVVALPYRPISRATPHSLDFTMTVGALAALMEVGAAADLGLDAFPDIIARTLAISDDAIDRAARLWSPACTLFVLGAGPGLATAKYVVAKFHEAFGGKAIAAELEDFAHGQHLAVRRSDLAVLLALDRPARARAAQLAPVLARLGVACVIVGGEAALEPIAGDWPRLGLPVEDGWLAQAAAAVVGQRLCLQAARINGLSVIWPEDHPLVMAQSEWARPIDDGASRRE